MRCLSTANDAPGIVILNTDRNGSIHKNHLKEIHHVDQARSY